MSFLSLVVASWLLALVGCSSMREETVRILVEAKLNSGALDDWSYSVIYEEEAKIVGTLDPQMVSEVAQDEDGDLRIAALVALCHIGTLEEIPGVKDSFRKYPSTRFEAGFTLAKLGRGRKDVVNFLGQFILSEDTETVRTAANGLGLVGDDAAIAYLGQLVHHPNCNIRATVLEALCNYRAKAVIPLLIAMVDQGEAGMACCGSNIMKRIWIGPKAIDELERRTGSTWGHYVAPEAFITGPATQVKESWKKWWAKYGDSCGK